MKKIFFSLTALAFSTGSPFAGDRSIGDGKLPEFLQQFDTNEDGKIDEEEKQAIKDLRSKMREERRNSIDTDGDGEISREEIVAARDELRKKIEERRKEKFLEIAGEDELIDRDDYLEIPGMDRLPEFVVDAIFQRLSGDDDVISFEEFAFRLRGHSVGERPGEEERPKLPNWPRPGSRR